MALRPDVRTEDITRLYEKGKPISWVAEQLKCSENLVWLRLKKLGLSRNPRQAALGKPKATVCINGHDLSDPASYRIARNRGQIFRRCKACAKEQQRRSYKKNKVKIYARLKAWYKKNPMKRSAYERNSRLKYDYGITSEDFEKMRQAQNGVCAICHCVPEGNLSVDHDHKTGKIRGLLCMNCNAGLGNLRDNLILVLNAAEYLKNAEKQ